MITAKAATKEQKYYCPSCHEPVILRQGHYYMAHFAHLKRTCGTLVKERPVSTYEEKSY